MILDEDTYLEHYGILRKSGRYPWGSGKTQNTRNKMFLDTVNEMKDQGMSDAKIAAGFSTEENPFSSTQLRALKSIAQNEQKQAQINRAWRLKDEKGYSNVKIGEIMGINESSVRSLLAPGAKNKADALQISANMLRDQVEKKDYIDIGTGVENSIGLTKTKFSTVVAVLREEGYTVHYLKVPQLSTSHNTSRIVLAKPGVSYSEVYRNRDKVQQIAEFTPDGGHGWTSPRRPTSVSSERIAVRYGPEGGKDKDGVIELRPGIDDLSMGASRYAQVRIAVDNSHYLKGMAVYADDLPSGVDIRFNTNKTNTGNKHDAMKPMETRDGKVDLDNPFTSSIKPGGQKGALNIVNEEGDWDSWSRNLPSQMLSKQSRELAKKQLGVTSERRRRELDEIKALTNPAVKKKLLQSYADDADSASVHLRAAAIPRQATKVLLPVPSVKTKEIYAPSFTHGERVSLVRFPHGGTFEIPELTVNNRNPDAKKLLGSAAKDAVGIHPKVAERLSGADFDGDTALVIPNPKGAIKSTPALEGLKNFDPKTAHPEYPGMVPIGDRKQKEMGAITNLIADMTIMGAGSDEIARAVRHSMVVIDADKHNLDYKGSATHNGIAQLKIKYQGSAKAGAKTIITRASSRLDVPDRVPRKAKDGGPIDRATGKKIYTPTGKTHVNKKGKIVPSTNRSTKLAEAEDAHTLVSEPFGTPIERVYADHSNRLKGLANEARKEMVAVKPILQSRSAKTVYAKEVGELNAALNVALKNAPLERSALALAESIVNQKKIANPHMDDADLKKIKHRALIEARLRTGAKPQRIDLTEAQWNAIQAGAISNHKLNQILDNSDLNRVKQMATPRTVHKITASKRARAKTLLDKGYTLAEVADDLGVSVSTLNANLAVGGD